MGNQETQYGRNPFCFFRAWEHGNDLTYCHLPCDGGVWLVYSQYKYCVVSKCQTPFCIVFNWQSTETKNCVRRPLSASTAICMYIYIYIYMRAYVYVCIYIYYIYAYVFFCMHWIRSKRHLAHSKHQEMDHPGIEPGFEARKSEREASHLAEGKGREGTFTACIVYG